MSRHENHDGRVPVAEAEIEIDGPFVDMEPEPRRPFADDIPPPDSIPPIEVPPLPAPDDPNEV